MLHILILFDTTKHKLSIFIIEWTHLELKYTI